MKKWTIAGSVCLMASLVACDKDDDTNNVNDTDRNYVVMASISNNAEIMAGQLAAGKASNAAVKMFGQHMVDEHGPAQQDLRNRASAVGLSVADTVDAEHKALMARLSSLSGYSFDTAYINSQLKDHAKTVDLFNTEINGGNNQQLRSYAQQYLPHIQMHYAKADSIRKGL